MEPAIIKSSRFWMSEPDKGSVTLGKISILSGNMLNACTNRVRGEQCPARAPDIHENDKSADRRLAVRLQ